MATTIEEFHNELLQDVYVTADASEQFLEDAFFELVTEHLVDAGELDTADRVLFIHPRGIRVDGYGGDPGGDPDAGPVLSLIILDFHQASDVGVLTQTDMNAIFNRLENFLTRSVDLQFRAGLEPSSPAAGLCALVAERWPAISKVRLLLISNRTLSSRVDGRAAGEQLGVPVTYNVWDLNRLYRFVTAGHGREELEVDLEKDFGGQPLPVLASHLDGAEYEAYLSVVPALQLAAIYDRWGSRLLEQNVRSFLQTRGNVNRGIRNTLDREPEMFFAYNNGITATAEAIESATTEQGLVITRIRNLQIVNGGQTTASIHLASRQKVDLSRVFVQMKLSIIGPELAERVVPKISQFANSQNRVNAADFFANHPFHVRMEEFSRRLYAPSADGNFRDSRWFYERARGQYQDERANRTPGERAKFDLLYPKRQVFTKTDLAKFANTWNGHPQVVSRGAQKNFVHFAEAIGKEWSDEGLTFNESYFQNLVAMAIVFHATEKLVTDQPWYTGGYRANIVTYAIGKLAHDVSGLGLGVDLDRIWREQRVPDDLLEVLKLSARFGNEVITTTDRNVTEWAKTEGCWSRLKGLKVDWPEKWLKGLSTKEELQAKAASARRSQRVLNDIQAQDSGRQCRQRPVASGEDLGCGGRAADAY